MKSMLSIILCIAVFLLAFPPAAFAAPPEESLLLYIDYDSELPSGTGENHLEFANGVEGRGGSFDGTYSGTYITAPDNITADVTDFTMATWVKFDSIVSWERIFDFGSGTANYFFLGLSYEGNLRFESKVNNSAVQNMTGPLMTANAWTHVALVQSGSERIMYVNGASVLTAGSITHTMADMGPTTQNYIGMSQFASDARLCATLDNTAFYSRALSETEIEQMAQLPVTDLETAADMLSIPNAGDVRDNITLVSEIAGATVTWQSSNSEAVTDSAVQHGESVMPAGVVTRTDSEQSVTLTATVEKDGESTTRTFPLTIAPAQPIADMEGYLYVYFRGIVNGEAERLSVHIASSTDGLVWKDLNANFPILDAVIGTGGIRDPYLIRTPYGDKFYLIATDLNTNDGGNWTAWSMRGSKSLIIWESVDLVNWSEPWKLKVADENIGCAWAPECIFDDTTGEYLLYFAGKDLTLASPIDTVFMVKTRDFRSVTTEPVIFVGGAGSARIDTNMIKAHDGRYYQFSKRDSNYIEMRVGDAALGPFETVETFNLGNISGVEGPAIYKFNGDNTTYCLMLDDYSKYVPYFTDDLASGIFTRNDTAVMPTGPKHGGIIPITAAELAAIEQKWGDLMSDEERITKDAEMMFYGKDLGAVEENITLPAVGPFGCSVAWESSDESVISSSGVVTRPAVGEADAEVTLFADISSGSVNRVVEYTVTVLAQSATWVSTADWSYYTFSAQSAEAVFQYEITPGSITDGIVALCGEGVTPNAWNSAAMVIRLTTSGVMDARNGAAFTATNSVPYTVGQTYRVRVHTDVANKTYSVFVTDPSGVTRVLADNFSYRSDAPASSAIDKVLVRGGSGIAAGLFEVSNFKLINAGEWCYYFDVDTENGVYDILVTNDKAEGNLYITQYNNADKEIVIKVEKKPFSFDSVQKYTGEIDPEASAVEVYFWSDDIAPE